MAKSATRSKSKRKKVKLDTAVDRISNPPDSLLCHILSFLPTEEAIGTSILSSRWKPLWPLVPALDIDTESVSHWLYCNNYTQSTDERLINFTQLVSRVLALHIAPFLRNFRLACDPSSNSSDIDTCIRTAIARNVQQLQLDICVEGYTCSSYHSEERFVLPRSFFSCKSVVVLDLRGAIQVDPPSSCEFPSLKILRLVQVFFRNGQCVQRLLSGCPVLEDLSLERDTLDRLTFFKISVPTLKRLCLEFLTFTYERNLSDYKLLICAPALKYFKFCGDLRHITFLEKLDNLIEADVHIRPLQSFEMGYTIESFEEDCTIEYKIDYEDRVLRLLLALRKAEFLSLAPGGKQCVNFGYSSIYPYKFKFLVQLGFELETSNWHVLQGLLRLSPNLEVLEVTKRFRLIKSKDQLCSMQPLEGPSYLSSHLTAFKFSLYEGSKPEVEFVKYILKEARVLKTATISAGHIKLKESALDKLSMFPRRSRKCLLTVER